MKKLPVLCFVLAGFAVRCDDANYYIIRMPEDSRRGGPFQVYWNVPTMQCRSKKILFDNLEQFGIIQNDGDSFRGNRIAIMYDPGRFPALLKDENTGKFKFRNGGVPQEGNLTLHLENFKEELLQSIPDDNFDGVAIIDFESWKPILRQNFGELVPYKDISYEIERKKHKWWLEAWIKEEAKSRFEEAGRMFMQNTISMAKTLRPRASWGYYGFPYCYNMASDRKEDCGSATRSENDRSYWLWSESSSLYPSVYSSKSLTTSQLTSLVRGRVKEAARHVRKHSKILPYVWYRYRDGGFLSQKDLAAVLDTLYNSAATGFIIWGSSNDVRSIAHCQKLHDYIYNTLGPAVANYTKINFKDDSYTVVDINSEENVISQDEISIDVDPEFNWVPPVNYTQDIEKYVNDEYKNEKVDNMTEIAQEISLMQLINQVYEKNQLVNKTKGSLFNTSTLNNTKGNDTKLALTDNKVTTPSTTIEIRSEIDSSESKDHTTTEKLKASSSNVEYDHIKLYDKNIELTTNYMEQTTSATNDKEVGTENSIFSVTTELTTPYESLSTPTEKYTTEATTYSWAEFEVEFGKDIQNYVSTTDLTTQTNDELSTTETVFESTTSELIHVKATTKDPFKKQAMQEGDLANNSSTQKSWMHFEEPEHLDNATSSKTNMDNPKTEDQNSTDLAPKEQVIYEVFID